MREMTNDRPGQKRIVFYREKEPFKQFETARVQYSIDRTAALNFACTIFQLIPEQTMMVFARRAGFEAITDESHEPIGKVILETIKNGLVKQANEPDTSGLFPGRTLGDRVRALEERVAELEAQLT